jgi:glutaredoxin
MKFEILIMILIVVVIVFCLKPSLGLYVKKGTLTLYGAGFCGWCKKQKEELEGIDIPYVDCQVTPQPCKDAGISAFPTFVLPDGTQLKGFQPREKIEAIINENVGK